jgi:hypothetical protein
MAAGDGRSTPRIGGAASTLMAKDASGGAA